MKHSYIKQLEFQYNNNHNNNNNNVFTTMSFLDCSLCNLYDQRRLETKCRMRGLGEFMTFSWVRINDYLEHVG